MINFKSGKSQSKLMQINEVSLNEEFREITRVLVVQPLLSKDDFERFDGLMRLKDTVARVIVEMFLKVAKSYSCNFVVFPELCMRESLVSKLKNFSERTGIIVIGGSFYDKEKVNICPITTPQGTYYTEKIELSPDEKGKAKSGTLFYFFKDSRVGSFCVIICSDYLKPIQKQPNLRIEVLKRDVDVVFVVSMNDKSSRFYKRFNVDIEDSESGCYIIYCNSAGAFSDGNSAIFGVTLKKNEKYDYTAIKTNNDLSWIICDLDMKNKKPRIPRPVSNRRNITEIDYKLKIKPKIFTHYGEFSNLISIFATIYLFLNHYDIKEQELLKELENLLRVKESKIAELPKLFKKLAKIYQINVESRPCVNRRDIKRKILKSLLEGFPVIIWVWKEDSLKPKIIFGQNSKEYVIFNPEVVGGYELEEKDKVVDMCVICMYLVKL